MEVSISYGVLTAIVIGLVEVVKKLGVNPKFSPIISIILSFLLCWVTGVKMPDLLIGGLVMGLSAVGLYSGTKNTIEGIKRQ